jgi:hypothetical protein
VSQFIVTAVGIMASKPNLTFLLGAGSSCAIRMPSTEALTNTILLDKDKHIVILLDYLKLIIAEFYQYSNRKVNYEDIYFVVDQIALSYLGKYPNPIVPSFIEHHWQFLYPLLHNITEDNYQNSKSDMLSRAFSKITKYIEDIIEKELKNIPSDLCNLNLLRDACKDDAFARADFFTLNHDMVLESLFESSGMAYNDGFEIRNINNLSFPCWEPDTYKDDSMKIHIFKLHGSINWDLLTVAGEGKFFVNKRGIIDNHNYYCSEDHYFLVGNYNKIVEYSSSIYLDLFQLFHSRLRNATSLIICGYGFADKGINNAFHKWIDRDGNRAIIIQKEGKDPPSQATFSIKKRWQSLVTDEKIIVLGSGLENNKWDTLSGLISK